ncbi:MAG: hypothetical protein EHM46_03150 [Bacteroidetes bacterium]|nr:MAG: hypothetical protein EHM46_03150 [Bacteroidota bacterium]
MKKYAAFILFLIPFIPLNAQREYLPTPEDLELFYRTKTYIVLNDNPISDYNFEIEDAVKKYWNITGYEFIPFSEFEEKSADPGASFLYTAAVSFEKDRSQTRYLFLCLSLGGNHENIDALKDVANLPLSYYGVDEDSYSYKLGTMVRFLQDHVRFISGNPDMVTQNVYKHYNDNMQDIRGKTLYFVEDELARDVSSEARIRGVFPGAVKIVERDQIKEMIMNGDENAVFLHKVGPEGNRMESRVYKILIGAGDAKFYYFDYHTNGGDKPDALLESDFKKLAKAVH